MGKQALDNMEEEPVSLTVFIFHPNNIALICISLIFYFLSNCIALGAFLQAQKTRVILTRHFKATNSLGERSEKARGRQGKADGTCSNLR